MIKIECCSPDVIEDITEHIGADMIEETTCYTMGHEIFYDIIISDSCQLSYVKPFGIRLDNYVASKIMCYVIDSRRFKRVVIE